MSYCRTNIASTVTFVAAGLMACLLPVHSGAEEVTLEQVLEEVPQQHETHQITQMEVRQSRALRRQALGALFPQLSATGELTRQGGEEVEIGDQAIRRRYDWGITGIASLTIFDGPAYYDYWQSDAMVDVAEASAEWERHFLELDAEVAFFTLASAQREVEIAEAAIEWRREYLEEAEELRDAGFAVEVDVSRARAEVLEAEQALLEADAARGNAADGLATLLGRDPDGQLRAEFDPEDIETDPPPQRASVTEERTDFTGRRAGVEAAELGRRGVWWGFAPRVGLSLNTRWGEPTAFDPDYFNWSLTLSATWDLYQGGARFARADEAQAEVRQAELELERDLRDANVEMAQAYRDWESAAARIEVARQRLEAVEQTYDQVLAQYEQGLVTGLEVSDASQELLDAEMTLNQVRFQARVAEVQYRYLEQQE